MNAFFAFLHHVGAFGLVAALAIEFLLIRGEITRRSAKQLLIADAIVGASASLVLLAGLVRVFWFEKGASYYFHSIPFLVKLSLFVIVALVSIYPTATFLSWRKALRLGQVPVVDARKQQLVRKVLHWELAGAVIIILCAALMARGYGVWL